MPLNISGRSWMPAKSPTSYFSSTSMIQTWATRHASRRASAHSGTTTHRKLCHAGLIMEASIPWWRGRAAYCAERQCSSRGGTRSWGSLWRRCCRTTVLTRAWLMRAGSRSSAAWGTIQASVSPLTLSCRTRPSTFISTGLTLRRPFSGTLIHA